jgi:hypothetical protein
MDRNKRAIESFRNAKEAVGDITKGYSLFGLTRGQFSMIDIIMAVLDSVGECNLSIWTWCIADYEVKCFDRMIADGRVKSALLVIDSAARQKNMPQIVSWIEKHGPKSVRFVVNHAKIATVETDDLKVLIRGSMNLNFNPRFEQFDIDEGHPGFDLIRKTEQELPVLDISHLNTEARKASGINKAWKQEDLKIFQAPKVWCK